MNQIAKFIGGPKDGMVANREHMPKSVLFVNWGEEYMVAVDADVSNGDMDGLSCSCYEIASSNNHVVEYKYKMSFV